MYSLDSLTSGLSWAWRSKAGIWSCKATRLAMTLNLEQFSRVEVFVFVSPCLIICAHIGADPGFPNLARETWPLSSGETLHGNDKESQY
jgi:hypothetical protein